MTDQGQSTSFSERVFIFCWHPKSWIPRAIILPYSILKEEDPREKQILLEIEKLKTMGPIIKEEYEVERDESGKEVSSSLIGYRLTDGSFSKDLPLLMKWTHYADDQSYDDEHMPPWYLNSYFYYLSDKKFLSTMELYDHLIGLKEWKDIPIEVDGCIMVTEYEDVSITKPKILRFFFPEEGVDRTRLEEDMKRLLSLEHVDLCTGYGFAHFKREVDTDIFKNIQFTVNGIQIVFNDI